jgi:short-subunit dehydrogenase
MKKSIFITGASSGLGLSLAKQYASHDVILHLCGRNMARLENAKNICQSLGAEVFIHNMDIREANAMKLLIDKICNSQKIDLVIANAGVTSAKFQAQENEETTRYLFDVNLNGTLNTILPFIPHLQAAKHGHIVIISSLAGLRGLPSCPSYSASKAAIKAFGEGLRGTLLKYNVFTTIVTPGFIDTPLIKENNFYMPQLMNVDKAALIIKTRLQTKPARIAFPFAIFCLTWLISILPPQILDFFFYHFSKSNKG